MKELSPFKDLLNVTIQEGDVCYTGNSPWLHIVYIDNNCFKLKTVAGEFNGVLDMYCAGYWGGIPTIIDNIHDNPDIINKQLGKYIEYTKTVYKKYTFYKKNIAPLSEIEKEKYWTLVGFAA